MKTSITICFTKKIFWAEHKKDTNKSEHNNLIFEDIENYHHKFSFFWCCVGGPQAFFLKNLFYGSMFRGIIHNNVG